MDREVTVRFYEIDDSDSSITIDAALRALNQLPKLDRERPVGDDVTLRLEHLDEIDGLLVGDITRVQSSNLPGAVVAEDLDRLPVDRIGHSCAFIYDPITKCMAFQFDMRTGISRMCSYLNPPSGPKYGYLPYLKRDTLERFRGQTPRKMRLKVSRIRNFSLIDAGKDRFEEQLEEWGALFEAPSIEIRMATSGEGNSLDSNRVWNTVRRWLSFKEQVGGIKNIEVETLETDDAFNFIKDLLYETETLELPDNDPARSRALRLQHVRNCYDRHRVYITRISGAG